MHWLPIKNQTGYKISITVHKLRQTHLPSYLSELTVDYHPARSLQSSDKLLLRELGGPVRKPALSSKSFSVSGPAVWNSMSVSCRECIITSLPLNVY